MLVARRVCPSARPSIRPYVWMYVSAGEEARLADVCRETGSVQGARGGGEPLVFACLPLPKP
jgi:hypothetical protein